MNEDLPVTQADFDELGDRVAAANRAAWVRGAAKAHDVLQFQRDVLATIAALPEVDQ